LLGFGHGRQACPGRYFAAHLAKVILCHLVHNYELKKVEEGPFKPVMYGFETNVNPVARIMIRKRAQEMGKRITSESTL
jgi:cytochrome P450